MNLENGTPLSSVEKKSSLPKLTIGKYTVDSCIVQGGMGVGISMAELSGSVSFHGGIGTLSAAGLHLTAPYRMYWTNLIKDAKAKYADGILPEEEHRRLFKEANCYAVKEEIRKAKEIAQGKPIFINIMFAVEDYDDLVKAACEAGVDGIVSGAGLPANLPDLTQEYPDVVLIPIVSDLRALKFLVDRYRKSKGKLPSAVVVESPSQAGGHLGAKNMHQVDRADAQLKNSIPAIRAYLDSLGAEHHIPVIAAGGIDTRADIDAALALGADGVQMGTRFLASKESGANDQFKQAVINATREDLGRIISNAGLPFHALLNSGTLTRDGGAKDTEAKTRTCLWKCLRDCGFTKGDAQRTQMCILKELVRSTQGGRGDGLMSTGNFFDENGESKIISILSVEDIMKNLVQG